MSSLDEEQQRTELETVLRLMKENGMVSVETDDLDKVIDKLLQGDKDKLSLRKLKGVKIENDKVIKGANTIKHILNQLNIDELTFIGQRMRKAIISNIKISSFSRVKEEEPISEDVEEEDKGAGKGAGKGAELEKDMKTDEVKAPGTEQTSTDVKMTMDDEPADEHNKTTQDDIGEMHPPAEQSHKQSSHQRIKKDEDENIEQARGSMRDMEEERLADDSPSAINELREMATQTEPMETQSEPMSTQTEPMVTQTEPMATQTEPIDEPQEADNLTTEAYQNLFVSSGLQSKPQYHEEQLRNSMSLLGHHSQKLTELPADNYTRLSNKQLAEYIDAQVKIYGKKIGVKKRLSSVSNRKDMEQEAHEITALVNMFYMARLGIARGTQTGVIIPQEMLGNLAPQLNQLSQQLKQTQPQTQQQREKPARQGYAQSNYAQQLGKPLPPSQFSRQSRPTQINETQRNRFVGRLGLRDRVKMNSARREAQQQSNRLEGLIFG